MKISVYDTYVNKSDGDIMHFDILVEEGLTDLEKIFQFGNRYLAEKGIKNHILDTEACQFCHIEVASESVEKAIQEKGYFILEMEGC